MGWYEVFARILSVLFMNGPKLAGAIHPPVLCVEALAYAALR